MGGAIVIEVNITVVFVFVKFFHLAKVARLKPRIEKNCRLLDVV